MKLASYHFFLLGASLLFGSTAAVDPISSFLRTLEANESLNLNESASTRRNKRRLKDGEGADVAVPVDATVCGQQLQTCTLEENTIDPSIIVVLLSFIDPTGSLGQSVLLLLDSYQNGEGVNVPALIAIIVSLLSSPVVQSLIAVLLPLILAAIVNGGESEAGDSGALLTAILSSGLPILGGIGNRKMQAVTKETIADDKVAFFTKVGLVQADFKTVLQSAAADLGVVDKSIILEIVSNSMVFIENTVSGSNNEDGEDGELRDLKEVKSRELTVANLEQTGASVFDSLRVMVNSTDSAGDFTAEENDPQEALIGTLIGLVKPWHDNLTADLMLSMVARMLVLVEEIIPQLAAGSQSISVGSSFEYLGNFVGLAAYTMEQAGDDSDGGYLRSGLTRVIPSLMAFDGASRFMLETFPELASEMQPNIDNTVAEMENEMIRIFSKVRDVTELEDHPAVSAQSFEFMMGDLNCELELVACENTVKIFKS